MVIYLLAGLVGFTVATTVWLRQVPFEANLVRGANTPYILDGDTVRNHFLLHLINKGPSATVLEVSAQAQSPIQVIIPQQSVAMEAMGSIQLPVMISLPRAASRPGLSVRMHVHEPKSGSTRELTVPVNGPPPKLQVPGTQP